MRQLAEGEGRDVSLVIFPACATRSHFALANDELHQIGASSATCSIRGSVRVEAARKVTFKRLKLEVGQDAESAEAIHIVRWFILKHMMIKGFFIGILSGGNYT